ncbi:hypothetical protein [Cellulomonas sp. KRMCY2]|uniref:hypothetical protein n=1 Tax=Cellulomonas sp. KRMCY2 TaxID=1304865 RepID=UPI00045E7B87|nr:hypothetical protein [Cellulomonas sp. KRMCY2]
MTEYRAARRRAATLALIPAAAGIFGGSVAWAGAHDPLAVAATSTDQPTAQPTADAAPAVASGPTAEDQRLADLTAQVLAAQARIAALQATLAAQASDAESARVQAADAAATQAAATAQAAADRAATQAAPAPAPAPAAPPVNVTTGASG